MIKINSVTQEKEDVESPALRIVWMQQIKVSTKHKQQQKGFITATSKRSNNRKRPLIKSRKQKWEEKQLYGYFKCQNMEIAYEIWICLNNNTK